MRYPSAFLADTIFQSRAERRPVPPAYVVAGRYDVAVIMREAIRTARQLGSDAWTIRMKHGLLHVWGRARAAMKATRAAMARPKMILDRSAATKLLHRIQAHPANLGRDILAGTATLDTHETLERARAEYRLIPHADRPALLEGLQAPSRPVPRYRAVSQWRPREWSWAR